MHLGVIVIMISSNFCLPVIGSRLIRGIASAVGLTYSRGAILIAVVIAYMWNMRGYVGVSRVCGWVHVTLEPDLGGQWLFVPNKL
jgi:hypothetical protein